MTYDPPTYSLAAAEHQLRVRNAERGAVPGRSAKWARRRFVRGRRG